MPKINGIEVYVMGSGNTPLFTLPGGPGLSSKLYRKYLAPLASRSSLVFWDYAGTGASEHRENYNLESDYADFKAILESTQAPQVDLLAHSYGSTLALQFAAEHPEKVRKLVLAATACDFKTISQGFIERMGAKLGEEGYRGMMDALSNLQKTPNSRRDLEAFSSYVAKAHLYVKPPGLVENFAHESEYSVEVYFKNSKWMENQFEKYVPHVKAQTLVITGTHDIIIPFEFAKVFLTGIPGVTHKEFAESGHWPMIEEQSLFCGVVGDFLSKY